MGRKGSWLSSFKKTLSPSSKEQKTQKSKKKGFVEDRSSIPESSIVEIAGTSNDSQPFPPQEAEIPLEIHDEQPIDATATATNAAESSQRAEWTRYSEKSREEAAIRIQTAFRGYLARRTLWALRGLVRLKKLVEGPTVKRQTANTIKHMQSLSRVQAQINSRRLRMSEANQALQRQLLQKRAKEIESLQMGEEWNDSAQSKEEMESKLLSKYEATMRRERAMAYSFSHQPWKKPVGTTNLLFMDPTNPQWGWSWLERYMGARPWEARPEKDHGPVKNGINNSGNEIAKSYARFQLNSTPSTPRARSGGSRKIKPGPSPGPRRFGLGFEPGPDDDLKSVVSVQSERNRRHSIAGSVVRDDESLAGSTEVPKYMSATKSAKAKSRRQSVAETGMGSAGSVKKQLSYPARRHSGPPKVESEITTGVV